MKPMRIEMELCNLPLARLMDYLVEVGGQISEPRVVTGSGWSAVLIELEAAQIGVISVPRDLLVIEGQPNAVERIHSLMRRRTIRGGG
jgi:hypothetical protein